jgi:hypothetical protein
MRALPLLVPLAKPASSGWMRSSTRPMKGGGNVSVGSIGMQSAGSGTGGGVDSACSGPDAVARSVAVTSATRMGRSSTESVALAVAWRPPMRWVTTSTNAGPGRPGAR